MEELLVRKVEMAEEEYIELELASDIRHEYVNGKLIDISGEANFSNKLAQAVLFIFSKSFNPLGYRCYLRM